MRLSIYTIFKLRGTYVLIDSIIDLMNEEGEIKGIIEIHNYLDPVQGQKKAVQMVKVLHQNHSCQTL